MRIILGKLNNEFMDNLASKAGTICSHVEAAVAYAEGAEHSLLKICKEKNLRLVFYGLLDEDGAVGISFLREVLSWGPSRAEARLVKGNFHPKVIWWHGYGAYVGSANLTHKAWYNNVEAGVFIDEEELQSTDLGSELEDLFDHLAKPTVSVALTRETIEKLEQLSFERQAVSEQQKKLHAKFERLFANLPDNKGLTVLPSKGRKENRRLKRFAAEWMETLELMRGMAREFGSLNLRPAWVDADAHPAIHFDQFLHAYYYDYVRGGVGVGVDDDDDDDDDRSGRDKVEANFQKHQGDPGSAFEEAARWWATLSRDPHGEADFIRNVGPGMRQHLSRDAIAAMDLGSFTDALRHVNAFRMHARQVKNSEFGLPKDHHESIDQRVNRLCAWLWQQRSTGGKTVRDVLEFVLWGTAPSDMEHRLWLAVWADEYRLSHFGQSTLGEAVGWARPNDFPPRNNRTNKALRALGHDAKLFSA